MKGSAYCGMEEGRAGRRLLWPVLAFSLTIHAALLAAVQGMGVGVRTLPDEGVISVVVTSLVEPVKTRAPDPPPPLPEPSRPVVPPPSPPRTGPKPEPAQPNAPAKASPAPVEAAPAIRTAVISSEQARDGLGVPVPATPAAPAAPARQEPKPPVPSVTASATRPAPPAPPSAGCPRGAPDLAPLRASYQDVLRALIEKYKEYPLFARKARVQGAVMIRCVLARSGEVRSMCVCKSSGFGMLDDAAARAVRSVGKFPPPPCELEGPEVTFEVPVAFRLTKE